MLKRWLHKRMKKSNEDPALNKVDLVSRKPRRLSPASSRSCSRLPTRVNAVNEGPPRMASGKRLRVSALDAQMCVVSLTYSPSEQSGNPPRNYRFVVHPVSSQSLITHDSVNSQPRLWLRRRSPPGSPLTADKAVQIQTKRARCVFSGDGKPCCGSSFLIRRSKQTMYRYPQSGASV